MRVYELAKKLDITSKELLKLLADGGFSCANHMAVVPEGALSVIEKAKSGSVGEQKKPQEATTSSLSKTAKTAKKIEKKKRKNVKSPAVAVDKDRFRRSRETVVTQSTVDMVEAADGMTVGAVADLMSKSPNEVIFLLLKSGLVRNINATLSFEEISALGAKLGVEVHEKVSDKKKVLKSATADDATLSSRLPVVVVMGHVDHGKTTLLDYIRKANVADREKGGITQHLGAYEVKVNNKKLIFLDTPGHEAFSYMRNRGTSVTDIVIIIVAANDGVKPQTVEVIELAKKAGVQIVVAINKIDKLDSPSQLDTVKTQLSQHDLTPEEWGGTTTCVGISAKTGEGVSDLLDMIQLHAEMLDLKTSLSVPGKAFVLETKQVKGFGWVATVICKEGQIKRGDYVVCGNSTARVRLLIDSNNKRLDMVGPSVPVQVVGFDHVSTFGDWLEVVPQAEYSKVKSSKEFKRSLLHSAAQNGEEVAEERTIKLILKADTQGSCHALVDSIQKIAKQDKNKALSIEILSSDVGDITEGDVARAVDADAYLYGLHVKSERNAISLAKEKALDIRQYQIIYHLLEDIEKHVKRCRRTIVHLVHAGRAKVLKTFNLRGGLTIAGVLVKEGSVKLGDKVVCLRGKTEIGSAIIKTLQRDKKETPQVNEGQDCGFVTDSFHGWHVGDNIEIYTHVREED